MFCFTSTKRQRHSTRPRLMRETGILLTTTVVTLIMTTCVVYLVEETAHARTQGKLDRGPVRDHGRGLERRRRGGLGRRYLAGDLAGAGNWPHDRPQSGRSPGEARLAKEAA